MILSQNDSVCVYIHTNNIILWAEWVDDGLVSIAPKAMNNDLWVHHVRTQSKVLKWARDRYLVHS